MFQRAVFSKLRLDCIKDDIYDEDLGHLSDTIYFDCLKGKSVKSLPRTLLHPKLNEALYKIYTNGQRVEITRFSHVRLSVSRDH